MVTLNKSQKMKVRVPVKAYITDHTAKYHFKPQDLNDLDKVQKHVQISQSDMRSVGWTQIGEGFAEVEIYAQKEVISNAVTSLRAHAAEIRAKAVKDCTMIEGQIQQLLAIEN